jgi:hypothetical protein
MLEGRRGRDAGLLELLRPGDHGRIELGPEVYVGGDELCDLGRGQGDVGTEGDGLPIGFGGEVAAVVGVAVSPVFTVEGGFAEVGDGTHASPCGWVGGGGENHAVIEENCLNLGHGGSLLESGGIFRWVERLNTDLHG